ncbi:beta-lactamase/transpeptidase-like protein [Artomyces pyxidatus]|uniref:Beta-lactamase/transpeptidase-like protein n=1 Tax=Artomyces pyxidatus TaxID=48021 RepID=A0ACB8T2Y4_9AGAM|nr:beta-lactamase/transpeptidase-like protein [Artomyces pyxidatus]
MRFPLLALTASLAAAADVLGQALTPQIDQYIQQIVALEQIPGLTVGVSRLSGASEFGAWGYKSEDGDAMTTDTLFNIGSCSKAFLSAAMGILIDDFARVRNTVPLPHGVAKFDWDTKVAAILPGVWGLEDPWASQKTNIADLLSHVTGLPRHDYSYGPTDSTSTVLKKLQSLRPAFELREQWTYNNMVGSTLGSWRRNYIKFVTDRIFTPLNMSSTTFSFNAANASGKATQTFTASGRRIPWWITDSEVELVAGPGGVISSVVDMSSDLFAAFATIWSSHALLLPAGGTTYQLYPIYIFPEGYGKNSTPFQVSTGFGVATFVLDKGGAVVGFGLNGTVDNGPTDREKQGGSIEETADAWFVKV